MGSEQILPYILYCFDKSVNEMCPMYILYNTPGNLPSDAGNNIAQDCQLLFGLVAIEMWFNLLSHVYNLSCYRLLFDPHN